jgi:predicted acyltransferase
MSVTKTKPHPRIVSMDQFRGYTVAGMFIVNFVGGLNAFPEVLKHHNGHPYFSYADSIMPSFMFAAGFSYRLTTLRRLVELGSKATYGRILYRSLALVLLSLVIYVAEDVHKIRKWAELTPAGLWQVIGGLLKSDLWEVLAIIGVTQILLIPVIAAPFWTRALACVGLAVFHLVISALFNFDFVYGQPNWLDSMVGLTGKSSWDGGFFGPIGWAIPMLFGSLAYDVVMSQQPRGASLKLLRWGLVLMAFGYAFNCLGTLYDTDKASVPIRGRDIAASPVIPPLGNIQGRSIFSLLATAPFMQPPEMKIRPHSYWSMNKKMFSLFSSGFAMALYALFIPLCDIPGVLINRPGVLDGPVRFVVELFRMFGQNPLAAYIIHHLVEGAVLSVVPRDSPFWYATLGLIVFYTITYLFVRYLDRNRMYLRL